MEWYELGDVVKDPYPDLHDDGAGNQDAQLWLDLFIMAKNVDFELFAILWYLRGVGCTLVPNTKFGYIIKPMIKDVAWTSQEQYDKEKHYLDPYKDKIVKLLWDLANPKPKDEVFNIRL